MEQGGCVFTAAGVCRAICVLPLWFLVLVPYFASRSDSTDGCNSLYNKDLKRKNLSCSTDGDFSQHDQSVSVGLYEPIKSD